ncbi:MAG: lipoyl(octanoyl) transferase LipB [Alphaproteobacteria bacterium]|nr:lipoyl(octanoyl) transferase LipB [Alphaproteobacteria bacterium]
MWPVEWRTDIAPVAYSEAIQVMEDRVQAIATGMAPEMVWLLEHPPLYTAGTSAGEGELLMPERFPVHRSGRGGRFTYHGPGQRVAYVMLDVKRRGADVHRFVASLEEWLIRTLAQFGVHGERRSGRVGIWVARGGGDEAKIAAIGVRLRRWISYHGVALNVAPNLEHFNGIIPCGIVGHGVTSLADLGHVIAMADVDTALKAAFAEVFDPPDAKRTPEEERTGA